MHVIPCDKRMVYVTGLPRAGSTLMCQFLGTHPQIYSPGHSSPLSPLLNQVRHNLSDAPFLLSQLDVDFDLVYGRLLNAYRGFINGWFAETHKPVVVDKNRGWLRMVETLNVLTPDFRMIVCIRDLRQVLGSIEARHRKTLLLDFPDHLDAHAAYVRADKLFGPDGVIGGPLKNIEFFVHDVSDPDLKARVSFIAFEALMADPRAVMRQLYPWMGLEDAAFDPEHLPVAPHESDSYYRFKYPHQTYTAIRPPAPHVLPPRVEQEILKNFAWFFDHFYSGSERSGPFYGGEKEGKRRKKRR